MGVANMCAHSFLCLTQPPRSSVACAVMNRHMDRQVHTRDLSGAAEKHCDFSEFFRRSVLCRGVLVSARSCKTSEFLKIFSDSEGVFLCFSKLDVPR